MLAFIGFCSRTVQCTACLLSTVSLEAFPKLALLSTYCKLDAVTQPQGAAIFQLDLDNA